jgi:heavy metal translocating P-type ATPase
VSILAGLALELSKHHKAAQWLLSIVAVIALIPILIDMIKDLRNGSYGVDILAATAIGFSVVLGEYWAAIVIVLMYTGGTALEDFAEHRAKSELDALLKRAPRKATVIRKNKTIEVSVDEINVGEKILIKAGDMVPVDAQVIDGTASFDESSLTGESLPQTKEINDSLLSGSINLDGPVTAKATAIAADSQYQQIIKLVKAASQSKAPFVRLADRYSIPFTFLAYAIATGAWVVSGQAVRFLEVIVVATPCPLLLAAPIAVISGMAKSSRYGIIVKTGKSLERFAETKTIAFDKTGTLTKGILKVESINTLNGFKKDEVLGLAAALEQNSDHPVANAIVNSAKNQGIKVAKAKHVKEISGRGLIAQLKGKHITIGRLSLLEEEGVEIKSSQLKSSHSNSSVFVAVNGVLAGEITLSDEIRAESNHTLARLKQLGIKEFIMVTGDNKKVASNISKQLGIDHVHAEALPADKLSIIDHAKHHPLAFVGDGVNDAPILTAADVGIALGARGSTAASESADVVIMLDDLGRVATGLEIAKKTFSIAKQSVLIGIGLSVLLMLVFATGKFTALTGAIVQEFVDVIVIFYALRAHFIRTSGITE